MRKSIICFIVTALICFSFCGCEKVQSVKPDESQKTETVIDSNKKADDKTKTDVATDKVVTTEKVAEVEKIDIDKYLDDVMNIAPGTAGSSLRCMESTVAIMDYVQKNSPSKESLVNAIKVYKTKYTGDKAKELSEDINALKSELERCINDWNGNKGEFECSGAAEKYKDFSPDKTKLQPLVDALNEIK